jgi:hypothetical protein
LPAQPRKEIQGEHVGDYTVIGDVSSIIVETLTEGLSQLMPGASPTAELNDLSEPVQTDHAKLTVFLYEITEDGPSRNRGPLRSDSPGGPVVRKPPMALLLRYLITAWGGDQVTQHQMLGNALQTLYDSAILDGSRLTGSLAGTTDALHLTLTPLTLDQKSWVWHAIQKPYRLSLNYEVRVVNLDASVTSPVVPVASRSLVPALPGNSVRVQP